VANDIQIKELNTPTVEKASASSVSERTGVGSNSNTFGLQTCADTRDWFPVDCWAAVFLNNVVLSAVSLFSGLAGLILDKIITFSIIEMGSNVQIGTGSDQFLGIAWTIMRDLVNIAFIFVLLYIGIMTIIKGFESGTNKMIATVIVIALVINFSLFFTKIIIDSSNIVAINFYNAMKAEITTEGNNDWQGVAGAFMAAVEIGSINKAIDTSSSQNNDDNRFIQIMKIAIGGIIILFVLGLVLFIASAMFITRYIILIILLVTSAAAIGSWILPSLKKSIYDKWWAALIGQSFFAPVFLLFLWISLMMTAGLKSSLLNGGGDISWLLFLVAEILALLLI
jgi:hypothetical protein